MAKEEEIREPGVLSYPASPGMTGDNRYTRVEKAEGEKEKNGRRVDEKGDAILSYPSMQGEDPSKSILLFRDGREVILPYPSVKNMISSAGKFSTERANLDGVDLQETKAYRRSFKEASMRNANVSEAQLDSCDLSKVDLRGCDLTGASMMGVVLDGCIMDEKTVLNGVDLTGASLAGVEGLDKAQTAETIFDDVKNISMDDLNRVLKGEESAESEED